MGTSSCAAAMKLDAGLRILSNQAGQIFTPSVFACTETGQFLLGEAALNAALTKNTVTIVDFKRFLGSDHKWQIPGGQISALEIAAQLIASLNQDCLKTINQLAKECIIAVPAHFGFRARQDVIKAAALAGLSVVRLVHEPTAAALTLFDNLTRDGYFVVFDCGGGTCDVSLLLKNKTKLRVAASAGDENLGGNDFDRALVDFLRDQIREQGFKDPYDDAECRWFLMQNAEKAKRELSVCTEVSLQTPALSQTGQRTTLEVSLSRGQFEAITIVLVQKAVALLECVLHDSGLEASRIDGLIMVGGSSRMPMLRNALKEFSAQEPILAKNPDESVIVGTAMLATMVETKQEHDLVDLNSLALGLELDDGYTHILINRNTTLPIQVEQFFTTVADQQDEVEFHIVQGDNALAKENESIARVSLRGLAPSKSGAVRIKVVFALDLSGILTISANDESSGQVQTLSVLIKAKSTQSYDKELEKLRLVHEAHRIASDQALPAELRTSLSKLAHKLAQSGLSRSGDHEKDALQTALLGSKVVALIVECQARLREQSSHKRLKQ